MITPLTGSHQRTYNAIFQHPISHNLAWREVHALFREMGELTTETNGNLKVTRNGQTLTLHTPRYKDVATAEELMNLRHFIERSEPPVTDGAETEKIGTKAAHWLVVINHHEARIYRSAATGATAQQIRPHAPEDFFRHAPHSKDFSRGQEKPDPNSFFAPVAAVLQGAEKILLFGGGTGTGSEMDQFVLWLRRHHAALALRIIGTETIDEHHLTEPQMLAKAREFYAKHA